MFCFCTDYITYEKRLRELKLFSLEKAKRVITAIFPFSPYREDGPRLFLHMHSKSMMLTGTNCNK